MDFADLFLKLDESVKNAAEAFSNVSEVNDEYINNENARNHFDIKYKYSFLKTRKWLGLLTFIMVWFWLLIVLFIVLLTGIGRIPMTDFKFTLSQPVLITLITTTTLNIIIFLRIVLRNYFPSKVRSS